MQGRTTEHQNIKESYLRYFSATSMRKEFLMSQNINRPSNGYHWTSSQNRMIATQVAHHPNPELVLYPFIERSLVGSECQHIGSPTLRLTSNRLLTPPRASIMTVSHRTSNSLGMAMTSLDLSLPLSCPRMLRYSQCTVQMNNGHVCRANRTKLKTHTFGQIFRLGRSVTLEQQDIFYESSVSGVGT